MREFMTRLSDYINEWREDPERKENQLSAAVIGAVAIVIIVLLLLLLWWGYSVQEKKKEESARKAAELQAVQDLQAAQEEENPQEAGLVTAVHEEKLEEYMSMDSGEELRREYLANTDALTEKIKELQSAMERTQTEITAIVKEYQGGNEKVTEKLTLLEKETEAIVKNIGSLEEKMLNLSEVIRTLDGEKFPAVQEEIGTLRVELEQTRTDRKSVV